jgi:hypothetical protein
LRRSACAIIPDWQPDNPGHHAYPSQYFKVSARGAEKDASPDPGVVRLGAAWTAGSHEQILHLWLAAKPLREKGRCRSLKTWVNA